MDRASDTVVGRIRLPQQFELMVVAKYRPLGGKHNDYLHRNRRSPANFAQQLSPLCDQPRANLRLAVVKKPGSN